MASTYSTNLAIELIGTGDQAGAWGATTNTNLGTLIEQAISGYETQAVSTGGTTTITIPNGTTGIARNMFLELTGTGGASTFLEVPANKKLYFVYNNTTGAVTVRVTGQTGVSLAAGDKKILVSNGTDIVEATSYIVSGGSANLATLTATSANITTLTGTTIGATGSTNLRGASANIATLTSTNALMTSLTLVNPLKVEQGGTSLSTVPTNGQLLIGNGTNFTLSTLNGGPGVGITNSAGSITITATGTGFIGSVNATAPLQSVGTTSITISIASSTGTGAVVLADNPSLSSATITNLSSTSAAITTATGTRVSYTSGTITNLNVTSANITTLTGTTFGDVATTQLRGASASITTLTGTTATYTSANITTLTGTTFGAVATTQLRGASAQITTLTSTSADITTATGTRVAYTSGTITNLSSTSANITTLTGTNASLTSLTLTNALKVTEGGTGVDSAPTNGQLLIGNGTGFALSTLTAGSGMTITNNAGSITLAAVGLPVVTVTSSTAISAAAGNHYILTGTSTTITLPASPTISDTIYITVANSLTTNVVARNGKPIQGIAEDMTLNARYASAQLRFTNNTVGWVLA